MNLFSGGIGRESCRLIIQAGADLSVEHGIRWQVRPVRPASLTDLFRRFDASLSDGGTFWMPESAKDLIPLRFKIPDTAYPFTIIYFWMLSNVDHQTRVEPSKDAANALVWYLEVVIPHLRPVEVQRIRRTLDQVSAVDVGIRSKATGRLDT